MPEDDTTPRIGEFVGVDDDGYVVRWNSRLRLGDSVSIGTMVAFDLDESSGTSAGCCFIVRVTDGRSVYLMPLRPVETPEQPEQQTPKKTLWQHLIDKDV